MKAPGSFNDLKREPFHGSSRNPGLAALMSFFIMGLGQIYAGHVDRGILLLGIQVGGFLSGYSLFSKGLVYDALTPIFSPPIIIIFFYFLTVILILVWIFNIKDAYYLSLFAGFRDYFEVERVMAPMLAHRQSNLLTQNPSQVQNINNIPKEFSPDDREKSLKPAPSSEETTISVRAKPHKPLANDSKSPKAKGKARKKGSSKVDIEKFLDSAKKSNMNPFIYVGIAGICFFGILLLTNQQNHSQNQETTLLALSKDIETRFISRPFSASSTSGRLLNISTSSFSPSFTPPWPTGKIVSISSSTEVATTKPPITETSTAQDYFLLGMTHLKNGQIASGIQLLEDGLQRGEGRADVWQALLKAYRTSDRIWALEDALKRYLLCFPLDTEGWVSLGKLQYDRQLYVEASRSLTRAIGLTPNHVRANYLMGCIFRELGMPEDAIPCLMKALARDPLNPEFHTELGKVYFEIKNYRLAKRHFEKALSVEPENEISKDSLAKIEKILSPSVQASPNFSETSYGRISPPDIISDENVDLPDSPPILSRVGKEAAGSKTKPYSHNRVPGSSEAVLLYVAPDFSEGSVFENPSTIPAGPRKPFIFAKDSQQIRPEEITDSLVVSKPPQPNKLPLAFSPTESLPAKKNEDRNFVSSPKKDQNKSSFPIDFSTAVAIEGTPPYSSFEAPLSEMPGEKILKEPDFRIIASVSFFQKKNLSSEQNSSLKETLANEAIRSPGYFSSATALLGGFSKSLSKAPKLNVQRPDLEKLWVSGYDKYFSGQWEEALPFFLEYLKKQEDPRIYECLSHMFERMGLQEDAFEAILRASQLGADDHRVLVKLGRLAEETRRYSVGSKILKRALKAFPHRMDLRIRLANCLKEMGDFKSARNELTTILENSSASYSIRSLVETELAKLPTE